MNIQVVNLREKFEGFTEYWTPKIVGELNSQFVKLAKFKGEFVMHQHEKEDELFLVVQGELFIELETETLHLRPGEFVVIPRGVEHKPYALEEVHVLLFEPISTLNTGNVTGEQTVVDPERI